MPPNIPNTAGRPSSLPQQIPPQIAPLGAVDAAGNVIMDVNWWLFFYNIAHQVLSAPGTPVPISTTASVFTLSDPDLVPPNPNPFTIIDWMNP